MSKKLTYFENYRL